MSLTAQEQTNTETIDSNNSPTAAANTQYPDSSAIRKVPATDSTNIEKLMATINIFLASTNDDLINILPLNPLTGLLQ